MDARRPPLLAQLLLRLTPLGARREHVEADLLELYRARLVAEGRSTAGRAYLADVVSLWLRPRTSTTATGRLSPAVRFSGAGRDVVFALRLFRRQPAVFAVAVAGLALAIGLTTTVFTVFNAMVLRPLGVAAPESLYRVTTSTPGRTAGPWMYADHLYLSRHVLPIELTTTAYYDGYLSRLAQPIEPDTLPVGSLTSVSGNYFSLMGVGVELGRTLLPTDDRPGAPRVVVLSHPYWRLRFGGDRTILGRTLRVGQTGTRVTVVGVAGREFQWTTTGQGGPAGWMTLTAMREAAREQMAVSIAQRQERVDSLRSKESLTVPEREALRTLEAGLTPPRMTNSDYVKLFARLPPGANLVEAEGRLTTLAVAAAAERGSTDASLRPSVKLEPIDPGRSTTLMGIAWPLVAGALFLVVALACANVTNLLLASAATREREISTRLAIGAGRGRIIRQLLTESLLLALTAGAIGLALSIWTIPLVAPWLSLPVLLDAGPDLRLYGFVASLSVLAGVLAGLAPARHGWRADLMSALKSDRLATGTPVARTRLRSTLIGGQAAGSVVLLVLAALLTRSIVKISTEDLGLDVDHLLTFQGIGRGYDTARARAFWDDALDRVRAIDGVHGAALTTTQPFSSFGPVRLRDSRTAEWRITSENYFDAMAIPILRGRSFTRQEIETDAQVAVISAKLAKAYWPNDEPLNSTLERLWPEGGVSARSMGTSLATKLTQSRIVGVVEDVTAMLATYDYPTIYLPLSNSSSSSLVNATLLVRTRPDPLLVAGTVQGVLQSMNPELEHTPRFVRDSFRDELRYPKNLASIAAAVGLIALGLAVVGLFGVTAFVTGRRRQEVGVRMALGATPRAVMRLLLRDSLKPVVLGLVIGVGAALVLGRTAGSAMYGVSPYDPLAITAAVLVLLAAALAAAIVPVRRAAAIDPATTLREM